MSDRQRDSIYVAELIVPVCFYTPAEIRAAVPNPSGFGITRGYWRLEPRPGDPAIPWYPELDFVIEFVCDTLKVAEDHALKVAGLFSSTASGYGGYPLGAPRPHRIGRLNAAGGIASQHDYHYRDKPYMLSLFNQKVGYEFEKYLGAVSKLDAEARFRVQAALHWYAVSISVDDPVVSYIAAWTGLESIGVVVNHASHPSGPKVPCAMCSNIAGLDRDRKMAGIEHIFGLASIENLPTAVSVEARELVSHYLVQGFSCEKAQTLRNNIAHGLRDMEQLAVEAENRRWHLMHALNVALQATLGPHTSSWITGDHEMHPDSRSSHKFRTPLPKSPFHGEWMQGLEFRAGVNIRDYEPLYLATVEYEFTYDEHTVQYIESTNHDIFKRDVAVYSVPEGQVVTDLTRWRNRPPEPAWKAFNIAECVRSESVNERSGG